MSAFTVATYNITNATAPDLVRDDVHALTSAYGVDVIALQEFGPRHLESVTDLPEGWTGYIVPLTPGEPGGRMATPILWNGNRLALAYTGWNLVTPPTTVEPGAGGRETTEKTVTWVNLVDRETKRPLTVTNTHALPTVESGGRPIEDHPLRLAHYATLMDTLSTIVKRRHTNGRAVFICGDLNVNYRGDSTVKDERFPYATFERIGVAASYRTLGAPPVGTTTTGGRLIDYVAASVLPGVVPVQQHIVGGFNSREHRPLIVDYDLRPTSGRERR